VRLSRYPAADALDEADRQGRGGVMELTRRELGVLVEVVERYIHKGAPVASAQVARSATVNLSPATVRSVMSELEQAGLLSRLHPSAGCIPTDAAFRVYVDWLRPGWSRLSPTARRSLSEQVGLVGRDPAEDLGWVARLVADVTREAGVAVRPMDDAPVVEAVSLVPFGGNRVMGVVVSAGGSIAKRVVTLADCLGDEALQGAAAWLTRQLRGMSVDCVCDWLEQAAPPGDAATLSEEARHGLDIGRRLFLRRQDSAEVHVAGAENLLQSEDFSELGRVRSLVRTLQDRSGIAREWRRVLTSERTRVIIGQESRVTSSGELGMVATLFFFEGHRVGALGVVGPRRMNYRRIVPVLEYIGDTVTQMLEEPGAHYA
jgi:heat-inducible transcriptional repressor